MDQERRSTDFEAYKAVLDAAKIEILAKMPKPEPVQWRLVFLVLPVLLTSILGVLVFKLQSSINSKLSLTQDYYKKRLEVYGELYKNLVSLRERAQRSLEEPTASADLEGTVEAFNHNYTANTIFLTRELMKASDDMWTASVRVIAEPTISPETLKAIQDKAKAVEKQMRLDLVAED
jgi:transcriptional regulator of met regulon